MENNFFNWNFYINYYPDLKEFTYEKAFKHWNKYGKNENRICNNIYGIYFICCINNYIDVIKEQLNILNGGLLEKTTKLIIFITNYKKNEIFDNLLKNDKFIIIVSPDNLYEKFAINNYKKYIPDKNYYLYYFHTKGVSNNSNIFISRRKLLNFYMLEKFNINIKLLNNGYDATGCSLNMYPQKHFSGNFWWSKSTHLCCLTEPINDNYLSPEMYILSKDCNYISLSNDTNDILFENYNFKNDNDIIKTLTTNVKLNIEHKHLI
jgi:hypothetical protein